MYLSNLVLTNFRNFIHLDLDFPVGVTVLFGGNAQGKTSILEAVYLLAIARSFRAENEHEVVHWQTGADRGSALVGGTIEKGNERLRVYIGYQCVPAMERSSPAIHAGGRTFGVRKQIRVSRVKRTASELVGLVNAVLFSAEDIELVQGSPSVRRRYIDILISQVDPSYLKALQRYQRVLHQRNQLLRLLQERRAGEDELAFWDEQLVKEGSWITSRRHHAMASLATLCKEVHRDLTGALEDLIVEYRPNVPLAGLIGDSDAAEGEFSAALEASRGKERSSGSTLVGPHRDDFRLLVNDVDMRTYGSRGQCRTVALTLRLAEASYISTDRSEGPIVLLDDVLSEMDSFRRERVLEKALQYQQVIITTTDVEPFLRSPISGASYFQVEGGKVSSATSPVYSPAASDSSPE